VSWVGSRVASGNTGTHTVKLYDASGDVLLRTATIDMAGPLVNGYVWAAITPLALTMGSTYTLEKVVTSGGQSWFDEGATTIPNATIVVSVLRATSGSAIPTTANKQFVGLNLGW
jgi:hypothetical protein